MLIPDDDDVLVHDVCCLFSFFLPFFSIVCWLYGCCCNMLGKKFLFLQLLLTYDAAAEYVHENWPGAEDVEFVYIIYKSATVVRNTDMLLNASCELILGPFCSSEVEVLAHACPSMVCAISFRVIACLLFILVSSRFSCAASLFVVHCFWNIPE